MVRRLSGVCTEDDGALIARVELSSGSKKCCFFSSRCADSAASLHQDGGARSADVRDRSLAVATAFFDRRVCVEAARHHLAAVAKKRLRLIRSESALPFATLLRRRFSSSSCPHGAKSKSSVVCRSSIS